MVEYIEREAAKALLVQDYAYAAAKVIDFVPTADVVEVRHGEWVHTDKAFSWRSKDECSECHYYNAHRIDLSNYKYCPNCGATMDGKGEGE